MVVVVTFLWLLLLLLLLHVQQLVPEAVGRSHKGPPRNVRGNRRNPGFVPSNPGVENGHPGRSELVGQSHRLLPGHAPLDELPQRDAKDHHKVVAEVPADLPDQLERESGPVVKGRSSVFVGPGRVGPRAEKLAEQISLRPHDLDAVVPGLPRQCRRVHKLVDGLLDAPRRQRLGGKGRNGGFARRGRDRERVVGVPARVQNLHENLRLGRGRCAWFVVVLVDVIVDVDADVVLVVVDGPVNGNVDLVDGLGDYLVFFHFPLVGQLGRKESDPSLRVGSNSPSYHQTDASQCPPLKVRGHAVERRVVVMVIVMVIVIVRGRIPQIQCALHNARHGMALQAGVHGSHQDAIGKDS
mmetsp:Transcript_22631/g.63008  ORF Transcript_22631/g.63008 Transcript_22631/m.63008 type:complete len:354 (+) Transcript_22631:1472-2533(+)